MHQNPLTTLGILGGGQLAKMLAMAALKLGLDVRILEKKKIAIPSLYGFLTEGDPHNEASIRSFAKTVDVITNESEFIDSKLFDKVKTPIFPSPYTLSLVQDKLMQKQVFERAGLALTRYYDVRSLDDLKKIKREAKSALVLKKRCRGYDGKGNYTIVSNKDCLKAWRALGFGKEALYAEQFFSFQKELAIILVRSIKGEIKTYPVVESINRNHVCHEVLVPARVSSSISNQVTHMAKQAVLAIDGVGAFGLEFFLGPNNHVVLNEIAPRVHNTGHYTIEGALCSQFENHIRALCGFDLGSTILRDRYAYMLNILGSKDEPATFLKQPGVFKHEQASVHIYGKKQIKKGRKMGHITLTGPNLKQLIKIGKKALLMLKA